VSEVLEPYFSDEIAQMVDDWWETLTPEEREKHEREWRIEQKWELLRDYIDRLKRGTHPSRDFDCGILYCRELLLAVMDKLERGEPVE
jgi:hypothetical protein